jgi:antitoxin (DNA-binding transcriptional repressor) of toxin-antitoxin stability system
MQIAIEQAKHEIASILQKVLRGEEVVIYQQDKAVAKLTPIEDGANNRSYC